MSDEYRIVIPDETKTESIGKVFERALCSNLRVKEDSDSVWFKDEGLPDGWFYDVRLIKKPYGFMLVVAGYSQALYEAVSGILSGVDCALKDDFDDPITLKDIFHIS